MTLKHTFAMRHLVSLLVVVFSLGVTLGEAQELKIKEVRSWAPKRLNFESLTNKTLPSSDWKRAGLDTSQFVVVMATAEVTTASKDGVPVDIDYGSFSITAKGESFAPIGATTPDGRARAFMENSKPGKTQIMVSGAYSGAPTKQELSIGLVFAVPCDTPLELHYGDKSIGLKPEPVATLQATIPVKISVVSSELVPELVGVAKRSNSPLKVLPVVAPPVGKVLVVRFLVEPPAVRNHEHVFQHYVCHSSDFSLVNGGQVVPLHKALGDGYILQEMFYQIPLSGAKQPKNPPKFTGELIFLVDPAVKTWDLYYGDTKVASFSPESSK